MSATSPRKAAPLSGVASSRAPVDGLLGALTRNLRRYRGLLGLSSSEVAQRSGVARATVSALEAGRGNPTLDTLSAIARVLGVDVADLVAPDSDLAMTVVRAGEHDQDAEGVTFRLLRRFRAGPCVIDFYDLRAGGGETQFSEGHGESVLEHIVVHAGELEVRLEPSRGELRRTVLGPGDYVAFTASAPHVYTAGDGEVRASLLIHYAADTERPPQPVETVATRVSDAA